MQVGNKHIPLNPFPPTAGFHAGDFKGYQIWDFAHGFDCGIEQQYNINPLRTLRSWRDTNNLSQSREERKEKSA